MRLKYVHNILYDASTGLLITYYSYFIVYVPYSSHKESLHALCLYFLNWTIDFALLSRSFFP